MSSSAPTPSRDVEVRRFRRAPPALLWQVMLGAAVLGRYSAVQQAATARAEAMKATEVRAAAEARRTDSVSLARAVDSAGATFPAEAVALDERVHSAPFSVTHDALHQRANRAHLDSAAKLLGRRARLRAFGVRATRTGGGQAADNQ